MYYFTYCAQFGSCKTKSKHFIRVITPEISDKECPKLSSPRTAVECVLDLMYGSGVGSEGSVNKSYVIHTNQETSIGSPLNQMQWCPSSCSN